MCPIAAPPPEPGEGLGLGDGLGEGEGVGDEVGLEDVPMPPLTPPQEIRSSKTAKMMMSFRAPRMVFGSIRPFWSELPG